MEYVSGFTIEQFWKEKYGLTPKDVLKKSGATWRHEVLNETFRHFTDSCFRSNGKFRTDYTIPGTGEIKSQSHPGVTGFTSLTSMKKLAKTLKKVQNVREKFIDDELKKQSQIRSKMERLSKLRSIGYDHELNKSM